MRVKPPRSVYDTPARITAGPLIPRSTTNYREQSLASPISGTTQSEDPQ